jgi:prevent-host-death family protein
MYTITVTKAREKLYKLLANANRESEPIQITGKNGNAILIAEKDWRAIQETLYLLSIPKMRESIIDGMKEPVENCADDLKW